MTTLTARLHPKWVGGRDGYRYIVCGGRRQRSDRCHGAYPAFVCKRTPRCRKGTGASLTVL